MKIERNKFDKTIQRLLLERADIVFDIELRGYITVLEGESCTGKSFFLKTLCQNFESCREKYYKENIEGVFLLNAVNESEMLLLCKKVKNSLICIDNGDTLLALNPKLLDCINYDSNNQYIIVSRAGVALRVTPNHYCTLQQEGHKVYNHFDYSVPGWK